nr:hypothetical protein [Tanacetum cinerariifolium]
MVNSCLKKLKFYLASFDMVVKERTTATAITEEKTKFQTKMENVLQENDRFLTQALSVEIMNTVLHDNVKFDCLNEKDIVILKMREKLNSLSGDVKVRKVKREVEEIETLNLELDHKVTKLAAENEHLKQTYKQLFNSIKSSCVQSKEHCDDLINKVNLKSVEVSDLNASLQEKVLVIIALKEQVNKLKGKAVLIEVVSLNPIDPALLQVDVASLVPKLRKNRTAHTYYIRHSQEEAATLREIVESERLLSPLNTSLAYACKYSRWIQELLVILQQTCPSITDLGTKLVAVTPKNKTKQSRRTAQITKSERTIVATSPSPNIDSNTPVLSSTGKAKKTELEDHLRTVKSSLNKASVVDSKATSSVIKSVSNVNLNLKCASCDGCLFSDNPDACVIAYINSVNASKKSKYVKTLVKRKVWKPTGTVFKTVGYIWKPTGRTFTLVGNVCPLTRIATATIVPPRKPILIVKSTDKPVITLVYTRKPKAKKVPNQMEPNKSWGSSSNVSSSLTDCRLSKSSFGIFDSGCSKHMTGDHSQLIIFVQKFLGTVKFRNDHGAKIMGYGDYQIGNVVISRVYYVEGLRHNLFSVGQFYDSDLEVAFRQHTCFIRNLDGMDLLTGSQGNNLYTLSLQDMLASSPICLLSRPSKTKSWLWHRRLSHLNFGAINHLARQGLVKGLSKLKFEKDYLCSACAMGKSTKKTHKPKSEDTNQEKLYLLHMDLCGIHNSVNASRKFKSVKKPAKKKVWKTTCKVFKTIGYIWKPTGRTFTLVGNVCPLTRISTTTIVPPREPIPIVKSTNKPVVTLVYTRKPKAKNIPNKMEPNKSWGI